MQLGRLAVGQTDAPRQGSGAPVVPNLSSSSGTVCLASRSTLMSSPARGLSLFPTKKVCAWPAFIEEKPRSAPRRGQAGCGSGSVHAAAGIGSASLELPPPFGATPQWSRRVTRPAQHQGPPFPS